MRFQEQYSAISPGKKSQIIRLFTALEYGEQLAHHCAREQVRLVDDRNLKRFLQLQSCHEAFHAKFFRNAAKYLGKINAGDTPYSLRMFGRKLEDALHRNDLTETLVGQQIVLETFGAAVLYHLNRGLNNHGVGLRRLRSLVLQQEQSHNEFGNDLLKKQLTTGNTTIEKLQSLTDEYLILVDSVINEMSDIFICLDENPLEYKNYIHMNLPDWLKKYTP